ncbi:MAG: SIR2 family protein [Bacteroidia bacterium]|nr:SIR2 family protein [Bacteroidia bacterium]
MNPRTMTEDDWNEIIASIEREECIIVLGPGAILDEKGNSLHDKLTTLLSKEVETEVPREQEKLFYLGDAITQKRGWRKLLSDHVKEAFQEEAPHPMFGQMARIPFHFYMSLSPDHLLKAAFESQALPCQFAYYNYKENPEFAGVPSSENPMILNLFGSMDDDDSMVLTHDNLFDFLFAILSTKRLPLQVKEKMISAYNFVLLGFDFESWYIKILLRLFESHRKEVSYAHPWNQARLTPDTRLFFQQKFKVDFVEDDVSEFITQLYIRCEKENLLREGGSSAGAAPQSLYDRVVAYIKQSKVDEAIDMLDKQAMDKGDNDLFTQVVMMSRRYNGLVSSQTKGTVKHDDAEIELNQIVNGLLGIAESLKEE